MSAMANEFIYVDQALNTLKKVEQYIGAGIETTIDVSLDLVEHAVDRESENSSARQNLIKHLCYSTILVCQPQPMTFETSIAQASTAILLMRLAHHIFFSVDLKEVFFHFNIQKHVIIKSIGMICFP